MKTKRLAVGFGWGVVATIAMSVLMILGVVTGLSPMPAPIPAAIVNNGLGLFGLGLPKLLITPLAAVAHLSYGGAAGAILAALTRPVTFWKGLGWGVVLWLIMATLVLHLVYGAALGLLMDRGQK